MITKYTSEIFEILRKGKFICYNSPDSNIQKLYRVLEDQDTFEELYHYFIQINYILESGDDFFYFSQKEKTIDLDKKIEKAFSWIDIIDFLKTYNSSFDVGTRFTASEIHNQIKNNADLKSKLDNLKKQTSEKKSYLERINKIINKLEKDNYVTLEDEISENYKVLNSFNYLKDLVNTINISEEIENEIPE